ncbi:MAG: hypothetical protein J6J31_08705 [Thermoguttaceae bacterium]|nr:hypothetical protein [Thermoguttaceae bacterium]
MKKFLLLVCVFSFFAELFSAGTCFAEGKRPYEMDWAGRFEDDVPPLADFESASGTWKVETSGTIASFELTNEQKIWGDSVGKLTYRMDPNAEGVGKSDPTLTIRPPQPMVLDSVFDAVSVWIYGNNWAWENDPTTPRVQVQALFTDANGHELGVTFGQVNWKEWFLMFRRLSENAMERLHAPNARFTGFRITNCRNAEDRVLFFDNFAIRKEVFKELTFKPRPKRGVILPQQDQGLNTGAGMLPFPNRPETILPENKRKDYRNSLVKLSTGANEPEQYVLSYSGPDGQLKYRIPIVKSGEKSPWDGISVSWDGSAFFRPIANGGVTQLADPQKPLSNGWNVNRHELVSVRLLGKNTPAPKLETVWNVTAEAPQTPAQTETKKPADTVSAVVKYTFSIQGKTLILETESADLTVADVAYGHFALEGIQDPKVFTIPYYSYAYAGPNRPAAVCFRAPLNTVSAQGEKNAFSVPLFLMGNTDWYLNNGSQIYGSFGLEKVGGVPKRARFNGGVRYRPKTDGKRNPCYERFLLTVSPDFEEILPTLPNPQSPWKHITGTRHWHAHFAGDRDADRRKWFNIHRHGITEVVVNDHEVCFRDGGESFTFRTKAAPGKGGDAGMRERSDFMNEELGFFYGPYNNFTDFAPVNEYWSTDMPSRTSENQFLGAWARCYAPKPSRAVEYCEKLSPINQEKFHFRTAYCDVHTAVSSSERVDYDSRVPGAGTQAATYYAFGEIMLLQKRAWNGPVYSEGNYHFPYCGLTDGNYAQDQGYRPAENPWLVNLDLRKIHDLCCNFGMGNPGMFYPGDTAPKGDTPETRDIATDRFVCATAAFGHPGFLMLDRGIRIAMRGYFTTQQLQSRFTQASAEEILYCGPDDQLVEVSEAIASGILERSQLIVKYSDGTVVCANGSMSETMKTQFDGRTVMLPPNGFTGWTSDGKIFTFSGLKAGKRCDYAESPAYIYLDGRGSLQRFDRACGSGYGVCRKMDDSHWEIIVPENGDVGFRIPAVSATALAHDRKELGPAELFTSNGFTYVKPVDGAFSYVVKLDDSADGPNSRAEKLRSDRWEVCAGETVTVETLDGPQKFTIPADAKLHERIWFTHGQERLDFCVRPLVSFRASCTPGELTLDVLPTLKNHPNVTVQLGTLSKTPENGRVTFPLDLPAERSSPESPTMQEFTVTFTADGLTQTETVRTQFFYDLEEFTFPNDDGTPWLLIPGKDQRLFAGSSLGANWHWDKMNSCGGVKKAGFAAHPPYLDGQGSLVTEWHLDLAKISSKPIRLEAFVGKRDESHLGDGIFYQITACDASGNETVLGEVHVQKHEWFPISADLAPWQGKSVILRLKTLPSPDGGLDTAGDWGVWAEMRFTTKEEVPVREILP